MSESNPIIESDWFGLYKEKWAGLIHPDAIAHPAKFARALIRQIYQHAMDEGWLHAGDHVLDCFGGVALGAHDAMRHGLHWTGCELESKFVGLGNQNITLWNESYAGKMPVWGSARLLQGDSRNLANVLKDADCLVSSPPFASHSTRDTAFMDKHHTDIGRNPQGNGAKSLHGEYSADPANLGNMRASDGDHAAIISSPPWETSADAQRTCTEDGTKARQATSERGSYQPKYASAISSPPFCGSHGEDKHYGILKHLDDCKCNFCKKNAGNAGAIQGYKENHKDASTGQVGAMREGDFSAVITSPPFVESLASDEPQKRGGLFRDAKRANDKTLTATYGTSEGQLGAMKEGAAAVVSSPPFMVSDQRMKDPASALNFTRSDGTPAGLGRSVGHAYSNESPSDGKRGGDRMGKKAVAVREHRCIQCGFVAHRDHNAALNIRGRADLLASVGVS